MTERRCKYCKKIIPKEKSPLRLYCNDNCIKLYREENNPKKKRKCKFCKREFTKKYRKYFCDDFCHRNYDQKKAKKHREKIRKETQKKYEIKEICENCGINNASAFCDGKVYCRECYYPALKRYRIKEGILNQPPTLTKTI